MKINKLQVHLLSDGVFNVDGGVLFGQVPKIIWEGLMKPDRKNRVRLGLNCLLIQSPDGNILVDTGAGGKHDEETREKYRLRSSKLTKNLRDIGVAPKEIHSVVFTHLHFDHAGGGTKINRRGMAVPTFPKAQYLIQQAAWDAPANPSERSKASYRTDDFLPLLATEQVRFLHGDQEIAPGISVKVTGGHSPGHQIVLINHAGSKVAFLGDLVPTPYHLALPYISAIDQFPEETLREKRDLLDMLERDGWLILFSHGYENRAGYLERHNGRISLTPAAI